jgi:RimJ/RimL family protein N-acetyltransferase
MTTPVSPSRLQVNPLGEEDRKPLAALLDRERRSSLYLRSLVHEFGVAPSDHPEHGRFIGARLGDELRAVAFLGNSRNFSTFGNPADLPLVLERGVESGQSPRLFVGPAEHATAVRRAFALAGAAPFLDREQLYYVLTPDTLADLPSLDIHPARERDVDRVTAAQASMTEEDLDIPRTRIDFARLREISRRRIAAGKVWVVVDGESLVFKTEESARTPDGVLVGGVFTDPRRRGEGLASRGIAAWARHLFREGHEMLALHVNKDNAPAVRAYERIGFRRHAVLRLMLAY